MLVTNFNVKYVLYKIVCAFYQLADVGLIHPMRERSIRALNRTVDYIEESMPGCAWLREPARADGLCLLKAQRSTDIIWSSRVHRRHERFIAGRVGGRKGARFRPFRGLPQDWEASTSDPYALSMLEGNSPGAGQRELIADGSTTACRPWLPQTRGPLRSFTSIAIFISRLGNDLPSLGDRIVSGTVILFDESTSTIRTGRSTNSRRSRNSWRSAVAVYLSRLRSSAGRRTDRFCGRSGSIAFPFPRTLMPASIETSAIVLVQPRDDAASPTVRQRVPDKLSEASR